MKVLFVISCNGGGYGGHNHSLNHISQAISKQFEVKIVSIGLTEVNILKNNKFYLGKIEFKWWNIFVLNSKFKALFKDFNPDVIHCFDGSSALILMAQPIMFSKKIIYTKCGGPNERNIIAQVTSDVILFSSENYESYLRNKRFKNSEIHLIPNRVTEIAYLKEADKKYFKDSSKFNFVRICRIGSSYYKSIVQSINLISQIQKSNIGRCLRFYLIGKVQDQDLFEQILDIAAKSNVDIVTITDNSTNEASRLLYLADAVIGTGRGVMEALSKGLPTYVPLDGQEIPTLIREDNFSEVFRNNFSQRSFFEKFDFNNELMISRRLIIDKDFYQNVTQYSVELAEEHFLITKSVVEKYKIIYQNVLKKSRIIWVLKNIPALLYYINSFRKAQKYI